MPILNVIILIAILSVALYFFNTLVPGDSKLKQVVTVLVYLVVGILVLQVLLGLIGIDLGIHRLTIN